MQHHYTKSTQDLDIRHMYEHPTNREITYIHVADDTYIIEGDRLGYDLTVAYRKSYEKPTTPITDSVTGKYGPTHAAVVREVTESLTTVPAQLGMVA